MYDAHTVDVEGEWGACHKRLDTISHEVMKRHSLARCSCSSHDKKAPRYTYHKTWAPTRTSRKRGAHTRSTFTRSTFTRSTLTISTVHEINHYKIEINSYEINSTPVINSELCIWLCMISSNFTYFTYMYKNAVTQSVETRLTCDNWNNKFLRKCYTCVPSLY